jgi:NADH dehydrogenase FAD-containing subunit
MGAETIPAVSEETMPRIVIVGGGFGGLAAAKALKHTAAEIILFDRANHHVFEPLLYQVATSELSSAQIAAPLRWILRNQKNVTVIQGDVTGVDSEGKRVFVSDSDRSNVPIAYDYLVLATGAAHSYFGHDEFEKNAPGLKSLADAEAIRNKILQAFELAEAEDDPQVRRALLTFILVGAGPTGVEMSGAIAELVHGTLKFEFRRADTASARVLLVDMAPRILGTFSEKLSRAAVRHLEKLGVEILLGRSVDQVDGEGVSLAGERIPSKTVIWTAGVAPSPAGKWLHAATDRAGRVSVQADLSVPGHAEISVVGDTMSLDKYGKSLPGVAQVAIQQGRYAAKVIRHRIAGKAAPGAFSYFDLGNMAVVGKGFAILQSGKLQISGRIAWIVWAAVHLQSLATSGLRLSVFLQWVWTYLTGQRGSQLIVEPRACSDEKPDAETRIRASASGG